MKLYIDNKHSDNSISYFFSSLEECIGRIPGISMASHKEADVILCGPTSPVAAKWMRHKTVIQRLDGIYFNSETPEVTKSRNEAIAAVYRRASGVIFQSQYSKNMVEAAIGKCGRHAIILNGVLMKQKYADRAIRKFPAIAAMREDGIKVLLSAAAWRPVKRMNTLFAGFEEYKIKNPNTVLVVAGKSKQALPSGVISVGELDHTNMMSLYFLCDLLINLSFSDACPNVVVEALGAKKPILASSNQGSAEVYQGNGYIIEEPINWEFEQIAYSKMNQIPPEIVANGIEQAISIGYNKEIDVSMDACAQKYVKFFRKFARNT